MKEIKFVTCINCIDGRTHEPLILFLKRRYGIDYVDMVTEPGPGKILAEGKDRYAVSSIKKRVRMSVEKHSSRLIVITGHYDCAGNPVGKNEHLSQLRQAVERVSAWGFNLPVLGIWINLRGRSPSCRLLVS